VHIDLISFSDKTQMNTLPSNQFTATVYIKVSVECVYICPVRVCVCVRKSWDHYSTCVSWINYL